MQGQDYGVVYGLAKFKVQIGSLRVHCSQIFANMIRIGSLNALAWGRIIHKIMVYGLLLDYYRAYYVNFITDESVFFIDEINAVKGFIGIVRAMKNATS